MQSVINKHYVELINTQSATNDTSSLRKLHDDIERHMRSLEALHQDVNQDVFISMITSKLPKETLLQLEIQKGSQEKWTVQKLRDLMKSYITVKESSELQASSVVRHEERHTTAEALVISTNKESAIRRNRPTRVPVRPTVCTFCGGSHWTDECRKYRTIEDRKQRLRGKCFVCLKPDHRSKECRVEKTCYHCKQHSHHRSLCPKKIPFRQRESSHLTEEISTIEETSKFQKDAENSLLSSGDIVLMQTAKTEVSNQYRENSEPWTQDLKEHT